MRKKRERNFFSCLFSWVWQMAQNNCARKWEKVKRLWGSGYWKFFDKLKGMETEGKERYRAMTVIEFLGQMKEAERSRRRWEAQFQRKTQTKSRLSCLEKGDEGDTTSHATSPFVFHVMFFCLHSFCRREKVVTEKIVTTIVVGPVFCILCLVIPFDPFVEQEVVVVVVCVWCCLPWNYLPRVLRQSFETSVTHSLFSLSSSLSTDSLSAWDDDNDGDDDREREMKETKGMSSLSCLLFVAFKILIKKRDLSWRTEVHTHDGLGFEGTIFTVNLTLCQSVSERKSVCSIISCVIHADGQVLLLSLSSQLDPSILFLSLLSLGRTHHDREKRTSWSLRGKKTPLSVSVSSSPTASHVRPSISFISLLCPLHFSSHSSMPSFGSLRVLFLASRMRNESKDGLYTKEKRSAMNPKTDCEERNRQLN